MANNTDSNIQLPIPPQGQEMPFFAPLPPPNGVRGRVQSAPRQRRNAVGAKAVFPKWLTQYAIVVYLLALAVVSFIYSNYSLPWYYMLSGVVSVGVFFLYGSRVAQDTFADKMRKEKVFEKRIFLIAFVARLIWMLLIYTIFMQTYGDEFGFDNVDASLYNDMGQFVAGLISNGNFHFYNELSIWLGHEDLGDMGYGIYMGFVYWLTGNSIIAVRILKCVWSSLTVVLLYRLAKRNFDTQTARVAAIFCALWPNFWYYCGCHLKEVEMVFLAVLFIEQADQMLRSRQFTAWKVVPVLLIAGVIFTFRTVLGMVALLALVFSAVMSSTRVVSWGKRIVVGFLAVLLIGVAAGNRIEEKAHELVETARGDTQSENMEWRANRKDASGNTQKFARYASKSVFAPLIFTIPFPTMVRPFEGQEVQQLLNGGNFIKNAISGLTIFALFTLLLSGKWREYLLPLSFMLGYILVLVMSVFAQSERFHQPAMPFEMMFAAYGLSIAVTNKKYKRWFLYWCGIMFVAALVWNWFKLVGRGLA